jgi:hypothetical protein
VIGRFLSADPLAGAPTQPQTLNRYAYALNNPVNRVDPMGLANEGGACNQAELLTGALLGYLGLLLSVPAIIAFLNPGTAPAGLILLEYLEVPILAGSLILILHSGCVT